MLIWPFLALTGLLMALLAYAVFSIEKNVIIQNWDKRRCDLPVMFGASYFKPASDPRTDAEFAQENFSFCAKRRVTEVMEVIMAPFLLVLKGQMGVTGSIGNGLTTIRSIFSKMYEAFLSFLRPFYQRYVNASYQVMAITQKLRQAYQKINTIVLAFVYAGLTIIRGMINVKDFIVKVVLIILGIMVALIVILFFVMAPFISVIIIPTIAAIAAAGGGAAVGGMADAFCLSPETPIKMADGTIKSISELQLDEEVKEGGRILAVIETTGQGVCLWNIRGTLVSSYHILWDENTKNWCFAKDHTEAIRSTEGRSRLFCLVTANRTFETATGLLVRDWEELLDTDEEANAVYEEMVEDIISGSGCGSDQNEDEGTIKQVETKQFYKVNGCLISNLGKICIGDHIQDSEYSETEVVGLAKCYIDHIWSSPLGGSFRRYELPDGGGSQAIVPITTSGRILIFDSSSNPIETRMDFTEVGSRNLSKTYDFVLSKLNATQ